MSLTTTSNRNDYTGDGSTVSFPYTYLIFVNTDLQVYVGGVLKTLTTDYTVSGVGSPGGGNVVFTTAPAASAAVAIVRVEPLTRTSNYVNNDPFDMSILDNDLDKLTMITQQLNEILVRSLAFGSSSTFKNVAVPDLTGAAGYVLQVDGTATKLQWVTLAAGTFTNPMTTQGDMIYAGASNVATRLPVGGAGSLLTVTSGLPAWLAYGTNGYLLGSSAGAPVWRSPANARGDLGLGDAAVVSSTTKGDMIAATGAGAYSRFAVGADGSLLVADSAQASGARWASNVGRSSVDGLSCKNNATTPNTKWDFTSANSVTLRNPTTGLLRTVVNPGTLTCDIGQTQTGSAADQRDQSAQFSSSTGFVHFYYIGTGSGAPHTLASAVAPPTGPTLPTGYTEWAYAGAVQITGVAPGVLTLMRFSGSLASYIIKQSAISEGAAIAETSVSLTTLIPANAFTVLGYAFGGSAQTLHIRVVTGDDYYVNKTGFATNGMYELPNVSQALLYLWSTDPGAGVRFDFNVIGYRMPNGDA